MQLLCHFLSPFVFCLLPSEPPLQKTSINLHFVPLKCEINYIENLLRLIFILAFFIVCFPCTALRLCLLSHSFSIFAGLIFEREFYEARNERFLRNLLGDMCDAQNVNKID